VGASVSGRANHELAGATPARVCAEEIGCPPPPPLHPFWMRRRDMIRLRRRTVVQRLLRIFPAIRRRQDEELKAAIKKLVDDPDLACEIEGIFIPNGRGHV